MVQADPHQQATFKNPWIRRSLFIAGYLVMFAIGYTAKTSNAVSVNIKALHPLTNSFQFINPLLGCELAGDFGEDTSLETKIKKYVASVPDQHVSVYFRGKNGQWVGINENDQYDPGSLIKVPIMMAYYKKAEADPSLLSKIIHNPADAAAGSVDFETLAPNQDYTVDQLIEAMIVNSDNRAKDLLIHGMSQSELTNAFTDLGVQFSGDPNIPYQISAKTYSLFFRILRNATYLNNESSEKALSLLAQSDFKDGLVAAIPAGVPVSHKFGQYQNTAAAASPWELHDCGLIYYSPPSSYLLCVMTKGRDLPSLEQTIQNISRIVYQETSAY